MAQIPEALALAIQHHQAGRLQAAEQIYRQILQADPNHADAHYLLGELARRVGRPDLAVDYMRRAIALNGSVAEFHLNLAKVYHALGRIAEAADSYRSALNLKPDLAEAHNNLGVAFQAQGKIDEAIACFRRALSSNPAYSGAHNNLGNIFREQKKMDEAIACFHRALELTPDFAEAHNNLGLVYKNNGKLEASTACFRRALELKPDFAEAHNNLGLAFHYQGRLDDAAISYRRAIELKPGIAEMYDNLGNSFRDQGRLEEAAACFHRALELKPDFPDAHNNRGLLLLLRGQFEEGWREYEHRLNLSTVPRKLSSPRWHGEPAAGRTILIHSEQGFGDAIQFLRYTPLVRQRSGAARVILETEPGLARLFTGCSACGVEIFPSHNLEESALPPFDLQVPLMSLPLALNLFEPRPMSAPYLRADPGLRCQWRDRLGAGSAIRVGLVWAGNPGNKIDPIRSMCAETLRPLLPAPGFQFYSLQIGPASSQACSLENAGLIDLTRHIADFADTAAFMAELDLLISVETAVVHLAGAMGRPVWTLLPFRTAWQWGLAGETSPWYPTMRLFRQPALGDWDAVIQRVAAELPSVRKRTAKP